jgi:hypothetical protein
MRVCRPAATDFCNQDSTVTDHLSSVAPVENSEKNREACAAAFATAPGR